MINYSSSPKKQSKKHHISIKNANIINFLVLGLSYKKG